MKRKNMSWLRLLCLALCLLMLFALAACGAEDKDDEEDEKGSKTREETEETGEGDKSEATPEPTLAPTPEPTPTPEITGLEIRYAGTKTEDFQIKINEDVPLTAYVTPEISAGVVEWSLREGEDSAVKLTVSEDGRKCTVTGIGPQPADSGGVVLTAKLFGHSASCRIHVDSRGYTAAPTAEIRYAGTKITNFTTHPGEVLALVAAPLEEGASGEMVWSMDEAAESSLRITVDPDNDRRITLECIGPLPKDYSSVHIYAEFQGVKNACIVYVVGG
ncbi:MAG: hypothetical protein K6G17_08715 [Oscillospiraceae bacterium]|nr:hypothetical protein [Oscillospiraceae bacterium]